MNLLRSLYIHQLHTTQPSLRYKRGLPQILLYIKPFSPSQTDTAAKKTVNYMNWFDSILETDQKYLIPSIELQSPFTQVWLAGLKKFQWHPIKATGKTSGEL